jgi:hypothetical protein
MGARRVRLLGRALGAMTRATRVARSDTHERRPNLRLKLAGGDRFKGSGVFGPGRHGLTSTILAPVGESPAA